MNKLSLTLPDGTTIDPVAGMPSGGEENINTILQFGTTSLFIVATLLALTFLIWGGVQWIISGGDKNGLESARKKISYAIIGLIVVFLSFLIINLIGGFFHLNFFST